MNNAVLKTIQKLFGTKRVVIRQPASSTMSQRASATSRMTTIARAQGIAAAKPRIDFAVVAPAPYAVQVATKAPTAATKPTNVYGDRSRLGPENPYSPPDQGPRDGWAGVMKYAGSWRRIPGPVTSWLLPNPGNGQTEILVGVGDGGGPCRITGYRNDTATIATQKKTWMEKTARAAIADGTAQGTQVSIDCTQWGDYSVCIELPNWEGNETITVHYA